MKTLNIDLITFEQDAEYFGSCELMLTVKSFDLQAIRKRYLDSQKRAKTGSVERREPALGGIVYLKIVNGKVAEQKILAKLLEPRGIDAAKEQLALSSENRIYVFHTEGNRPYVIDDSWLSYIHTVRFNKTMTRLLVTSSGVDTILEFDLSDGKKTWEWVAWENGFNQGENPVNGEKHFLTRSEQEAEALRRENKTVYLVKNPQKEHLPTAMRAAFMNTAEYGKQGEILATLFHHGWVLRIPRDMDGSGVLIEGLSKPHGGVYFQDGYLVTDTGGGRVVHRSGDNFVEYLFYNLPEKDPLVGDMEWLQTSRPLGEFIITVDSNRNNLTFFDPRKKKRMHISYDKNWAVQEFTASPHLHKFISQISKLGQ